MTMNRKSKSTSPVRAKPSVPRSEFLTWFEQQAGKPPISETDYLKLRHETLPGLRAQLATAEQELKQADYYYTAKQYALYAWRARDEQ